MSLSLHDLLDFVVEQNASDLHLHVGQAPALRVVGEIAALEAPPLTPEDTSAYVKSIAPPHFLEQLEKRGNADFGYDFGKARFRVSIFKVKGNYEMVMRQIPNRLFTLEELGLPGKIKDILQLTRGLVLVTGPTGSGKTSTLAAMVNWLNERESLHIVTIEDPIEYYHPHKHSIVTQRELHKDVNSFSDAIRAGLRQDPDVMLVGEMRDLETIEAAITAAETGHLVFATLHTTGAARTVDRIIDAFPANTKEQIRIQLSANLVAVVSQVLCKRKDGSGRIAAFEIMTNTPAIAASIRENKTHRIVSDIQTGANHGMITMDAYLLNLFYQGTISAEEAITYSQDTDEMRKKCLTNLPQPSLRHA